jgi:hypothetical protein
MVMMLRIMMNELSLKKPPYDYLKYHKTIPFVLNGVMVQSIVMGVPMNMGVGIADNKEISII